MGRGDDQSNVSTPEFSCTRETSQGNVRAVPGLKLTSHAKLATHVGAGELPDPSIVPSMPIIRPLKSGGSAAADAHHP